MWKGRIACLALCLAACSLDGGATARLEAEPQRGAGAAGPAGSAKDAELDAFITRVIQDADQSWAGNFQRRNKPYQAARAVTFSERAPNRCARVGLALSAECQDPGAVYVDLDFQRALRDRYGDEASAPGAYAIAHAVGHHVQKVLGLDRKAAGLLQERPVSSHSVELQLELQADCFAGVWARVSKSGVLPRERVEEALKQASEVGNDQRRLDKGDESRPLETFTYAIPRRRLYWFAKGYGAAKIEDCDPFAE